MSNTTDKPRQTISITRKPAMPATTTTAPETGVVKRTGKRIIKRDQLPAATLTRPGKFEKPKPKPAKATRKPRQPPKPPKTPPSDLRARELSDSLNNFTVWRECLPLALGIEKQIFRHIADLHLSASKRVVSKALHYHTHKLTYLLAVGRGGMRFNLDGTDAGAITQGERDHAGRVLAAMPQST
ncbi:ProQ/FINO family protein [Thiothrix subterranea]|uniref:ProQ/FINO family protein n=1 Tax=Thiothrix subterranea TaxID=2735563 RepID=A0AA51R1J7_9GAMM|nr:ProQ/FINO family protein [Thiothrix subterranea]MDQ5770478.1 ProQ/FINO family protein [Thiothrix subterranea]WML86844.1 ProQ/FINO family protein [Thiothrix subterranea]